jgi:hypothetical protein
MLGPEVEDELLGLEAFVALDDGQLQGSGLLL